MVIATEILKRELCQRQLANTITGNLKYCEIANEIMSIKKAIDALNGLQEPNCLYSKVPLTIEKSEPLEYRIKESIFSDGTVEYFPEYYSEDAKQNSMVNTDGWVSASEMSKKILGWGYDTYEKAEIQINNHKQIRIEGHRKVKHEIIHNAD